MACIGNILMIMCCLDAPTITQSPGPISGIQSQEFSLRCTAEGHPDPKYEFFKVSLQVQTFSVLKIRNIPTSIYICVLASFIFRLDL
jgi:hypothetical protein